MAVRLTKSDLRKEPTEKQFTRQVLEFANLYGWRTAHFRPARTAKGWRTAVSGDGKGWPDLFLVRRGRIVVAELKVGRNQTSAEQELWLEEFRKTQAEVYVWHPSDWNAIRFILSSEKI